MTLKVITRRSGASPLIGIYSIFSTMSKHIPKVLKFGQDLDFFVEFKNRKSRMIVDDKIWHKAGLLAMERMQYQEYVNTITNGLLSEKSNLMLYGDKLLKTKFESLSNNELAKLFKKSIDSLERFNYYNSYILAAEFYHELFTKKLKSILEKVCKNTSISVNEAYVILTTSKKLTWVQKHEEDFLKMLIAHSRNRNKIDDILNSHLKKYFWIQYEQEGEFSDKKYFLNLLSSAAKQKENPTLELKRIHDKRKEIITKQKKIKNLINLSSKDKYWFSIATKLIFWTLHLREIKIRFYACTDDLMKEIAKRLNLNKIEVRHMNCEELIESLKNEKTDVNLLKKRIKYCVVHFYKEKVEFLLGKQAAEISNRVEQEANIDSIKEIKGNCAFQGYAKGIVKQVLRPEDMKKFNEGDILVAYMTDPGVVPAMKKAAAIVTDVGGITCHAAIMSREFGIPCVVGTKIATEVLKNGYMVEVDASKGVIKILRREKS